MRFVVPQFIERESKILGPLDLKQFIVIGTAVAICFLFYFFLPLTLFIIACIVIIGTGIIFSFLKIGGIPLPSVLASFLKFSIGPKIYIWRKKEQPEIKIYKEETKIKDEKSEEGSPLKIAGNSRLKKLNTQIEIKTR